MQGNKHPLVGAKIQHYFELQNKGADYFSTPFRFLSLKYAFMRRQPSTPTIARPTYCVSFAMPKNIINSTKNF
jgi:hypothetical protein